MRVQIGLLLFGVLATVAVGLWIARLVPKEPGDYAALAVLEHADGRVEAVVAGNVSGPDECTETQRIAKAFLQVHPDVRSVGLACVRVTRNIDGAAR